MGVPIAVATRPGLPGALLLMATHPSERQVFPHKVFRIVPHFPTDPPDTVPDSEQIL
jgi:hypothetical protein